MNVSRHKDAVNFIGWRLFSCTISTNNQNLMEKSLKHNLKIFFFLYHHYLEFILLHFEFTHASNWIALNRIYERWGRVGKKNSMCEIKCGAQFPKCGDRPGRISLFLRCGQRSSKRTLANICVRNKLWDGSINSQRRGGTWRQGVFLWRPDGTINDHFFKKGLICPT